MKRFNWRSWLCWMMAALAVAAPALLAGADAKQAARLDGPGTKAPLLSSAASQPAAAPAPALLSKALVDWSTYVGSANDDYVNDLARDSSGNIVVVGTTFSEGWIANGFNTNYAGSRDAFVVKFDATGAFLWSTYLGGSSDDHASGVAVDAEGNIYVTGGTRSRSWVSGGFDTNYHDVAKQDAFVVKLSPAGAHLWSTFLGGSEWEEAWGIAVDAATNVLVSGYTESSSWIGRLFNTNLFGPTNYCNKNYGGGGDAFVVKLTGSGTNLWAAYLGGTARDEAFGVAADSANNVLVTGDTLSSRWVRGVPGTNYFGTNYNTGGDAFVAKLSSAGSNLWSTYLGGKYLDHGDHLAVDATDSILVSGYTSSSNWISGGFQTNYRGREDAFVAKLTTAGAPLWSTYVGGASNDFGSRITVDRANGNVFVTGTTHSPGWTRGGFDTNGFGPTDAFVAKLDAAGQHVWSSYLGGTSYDGGGGIALDGAGNIFVGGFTTSSNWIRGTSSTNYNVDGFVVRISDTMSASCPLTLASPTPLLPACGSNVLDTWFPTLSWTVVNNASNYVVRIYLGTNNCAAWPIYISPRLPGDTNNFFVVPAELSLQFGQTYSWNVQALGDGVTYCDSPWGSCCSFTVRVTDRTAPSVSIANLVQNQRFTNNVVTNGVLTVRGTASDNLGISRVFLNVYTVSNELSGGMITNYWSATGTTTWQADLPLASGTNIVVAFSQDLAGNLSLGDTRFIYFVVPSPLTLVTNPAGRGSVTFSSPLTTNVLEVGRAYRVTAAPANGWLFSNWNGSITVAANPPLPFTLTNSGLFSSALAFFMQSNLVLRANFITNHFLAFKGVYNGLFYPTNGQALSPSNSGYFSLTLADRGTFSGRLLLAGMTLGFSGAFDVNNTAQVVVRFPVRSWWPLDMTLRLDTAQQSVDGLITATDMETRRPAWQAEVKSDRVVPTTPLAGTYTLLANGSADPAASPAGFGAAAVTVMANGTVLVRGTLADSSPLSQSTTVAADGMWPLYQLLSAGKGVFIGWMGLNTNSPTLWTKLPLPGSRYYTNGFTLTSTTVVARYVPPAAGQSVLRWTDGNVVIGGGNLNGTLTNQVTLTNNQVRNLGGAISNLSLTLSSSDGSFSGSFVHPATRSATSFKGALVQDTNFPSGGWFLGTNQSGFIRLEPR